jgi:hypothetical protein
VSGMRPDGVQRIHFSCDGPISLMSNVPISMIKHGDTASASTPDEPEQCYLWLCVPVPAEIDPDLVIGTSGPPGGVAFGWECVEEWTEARSREYIVAADLVAVVSAEFQKDGGA